MLTAEKIREIVERIKDNQIGCTGCIIKDLVIDFLRYRNPASREALVELAKYAEYRENAHVQFLANEALELCN